MAGTFDRRPKRMRDRRAERAQHRSADPPAVPRVDESWDPRRELRSASLVYFGAALALGVAIYFIERAIIGAIRHDVQGDAVLGQKPFDLAVVIAFLAAWPTAWFVFRSWIVRRLPDPKRRALVNAFILNGLGKQPRRFPRPGQETRLGVLMVHCLAGLLIAFLLYRFVVDATTYAYVNEREIVWRLGPGSEVCRGELSRVTDVRIYETRGRKGRRSPKVDVRFADGFWFRGESIPSNWEERGRFAGQVARAAGVRVTDGGYSPWR